MSLSLRNISTKESILLIDISMPISCMPSYRYVIEGMESLSGPANISVPSGISLQAKFVSSLRAFSNTSELTLSKSFFISSYELYIHIICRAIAPIRPTTDSMVMNNMFFLRFEVSIYDII